MAMTTLPRVRASDHRNSIREADRAVKQLL